MKAVVFAKHDPRSVVQLKDVPKPTPKDDEILVKVHAASVNAYDYRFLRGGSRIARTFGGLMRKDGMILGADFSGVVESAGQSVPRFKPGDGVFGCGRGSFAEYICVGEDRLILKPADISFEDAAAVPMAALTALQSLRDKGHIRSGQKVLIQGAGGGLGTFAVQIAKSFGAEVTAVSSAQNAEIERSIGADHVIDYGRVDFTRSGRRYDLILAANGSHSIFAYKRALDRGGRLVVAGGSMAQLFQAMLLGPAVSLFGSRKLGSMLAKINRKDLDFLMELYHAGKIKSVIDRRYPFVEADEAIRYLEQGHARGKVVIRVIERDS